MNTVMNSQEVNQLRKEVENRMYEGKSFSVKEVREIMKQTGLSYVQVVKRTKALDKQIKAAEKEALEKGEPFDRSAYISKRMKG